MKNLFILLFLPSTFCAAQKVYEFDYLIEYKQSEHEYRENSNGDKETYRHKSDTVFYLTNSRDNSYILYLLGKDGKSNQMKWFFKDAGGNEFYTAAGFTISSETKSFTADCDIVNYSKNLYTSQVDDFRIYDMMDTIIDGTSYNRYNMAMKNPRKTKRKKAQKEEFIIEPNTEFHLPIATVISAPSFWVENEFVPNGIFRELISDYKLESVYTHQKLNKITKVQIKIIIPKECDKTRVDYKAK